MRKKTTEEFKKQMQAINPNIKIIGEYQGNKINIACKCKVCSHEWEARPDNLLHIKVIITCPIHNDFEQTPSNHLQGHGCPKCNASKGELFVEQYLLQHHITFEKQYCINIPTTINPSGQAYIDFYIPACNTFIEYNGRQHYIPLEYFGGVLGLKHQEDRDNYVRNFCKDNSYTLIEIPYTMKDEEIVEILNLIKI